MSEEKAFTALRTAKRRNVSDDLVRQLERAIVRGEADPGARLPPEREMAERFGVGRSTVREALRILGQKGLVEIRPGKGAFVADYLARATIDFLGALARESDLSAGADILEEVLEFRGLVEVPMAGLAALRADSGKMSELAELVARETEVLDDPAAFAELNYQFHRALADLSGNRVFHLLLNTVGPVYRVYTRVFFTSGNGVRTREVHDFHLQIVSAIEKGDAEATRHLMRLMLDRGAEGMRESLKQGVEGV